MQSGNARTSSTPATGHSSTLRPRPRRLISGLDDGEELVSDPSSPPRGSRFTSRDASPIPAERLSRPGSSRLNERVGNSVLARGTGVGSLDGRGQSPSALAGLWGNSWTALQGIATDLLGSDVASLPRQPAPRTRKPMSKLEFTNRASSVTRWGPTSAPMIHDVAAGSKQDAENAVRARKRKDMLLQQDSSYADTLGKFKRRTSDDDRATSSSAPPDDREALVYLHHVQKADTLAGITIRYNCSANTVRKANRMWPNDTVHSREAIVLPVDACGVKGRPVSGPEAVDLLSDESDSLAAGQAKDVTPITNGHTAYPSIFDCGQSSTTASNADIEPPWHHDSWVLLPNATQPTEIVRLSRQSLGYFPPARRKENCYSDLNTPSSSFDLSRSPVPDLPNLPAMSPSRADPPQRPPRTRKLSSATTGYFPSYLTGPGGVGSMSADIRSPGPGQDSLNAMFARHLPDVAPPKNQQSLYPPEMPLYTDAGTPVGSGTATPNVAHALNLEHVGGAIEHWVRRVASKAKGAVEPGERSRAARTSVGQPGMGGGDVGDLIEMTDEFEIGGDESEEEGRGRQGSQVTELRASGRDAGHSQVRKRELSKGVKDD
ncbi:hypothetical protein B0A48_12044 [Cryoendolithus antarcticus]|uniref:LysM domain-containing protein n=1 Tax=Cryoendolithus antarcticus TaxID=1507870 RepID=A0A1V8STJ6_9PEZI|nr:hypothetical protein B0A48_12044 [Cryoendolithus antarcticus]